MEKVRSFGRSRSLGSGMKRFPFTSAPDPPELIEGDDDGFRWSSEVSKQRASPPRLLAPSEKDTDRISSPTLRIGAQETPPTSPPRNKKKPGRTKRTLNALALLDGSNKHGSRSATPDAPGYGEAAATPNIAQYQADQVTARTDGSGKPIRTLEIPTAGPPKRTDDRSVLTDEMSNLHEHMLSKQRMAEMQADDDVSALSMGTAGREFYGWDAEGMAKSGAFGLGKKKSPNRPKKSYGLSGGKNNKHAGKPSPMATLGAISETNEMAPQAPTAVNELTAWASAVESTPPMTKRKKPAAANNKASDEDLMSPSAVASARSMSPRCKKTGNSPSRSSPRAHISSHSSGELLRLNYRDEDNELPAVDVLANPVADSKLGKPSGVGSRSRSPESKGGEIHDDVTMVRTNSQGHLACTSPESVRTPKVNRYSQAIGSFDQSIDVATEQNQMEAKSPLYIIASYDSNDNSLLQSRLSFPPAHKMVTEGIIPLNSSGTPPRQSSGDEYIDAYQQTVNKYNDRLTPASPARSTKSSATTETAALSRTSTPVNSPARSASKPPSISTGSSSTGDKKSKSSLTGGGLKNLVRMPSLRKARSMGRSASLKAMFSTTKAAEDNIAGVRSTPRLPENNSGGGIDFINVGHINEDELAKRQEIINRRRSSFSNKDSLEQNDSNDSLEDDDYTEEFNVVKEIMENNAGTSTKMRANTFDTGYTGYTGYTSDALPSMENGVGNAISDLFCFNPLSAFDIDNICHPTVVKATTGREPQRPMSDTASYLAVNNDGVNQVPSTPAFGEHRRS